MAKCRSKEFLAGDHSLSILYEKFEQLEFLRCQFDGLTIECDFHPDAVNANAVKRH